MNFFCENIWDIIQSLGILAAIIFSAIAAVQTKKANASSNKANEIAKKANLSANEANEIAKKANGTAGECKNISLAEFAPAINIETIKIDSKKVCELINETTFDFQAILINSDNQYEEYEIIELEFVNSGKCIVTGIKINKVISYIGNEYSLDREEDTHGFKWDDLKNSKEMFLNVEKNIKVNLLNKYEDYNLNEFIQEAKYGVLTLELEINVINNICYIETITCYYSVDDDNNIKINRKTIDVKAMNNSSLSSN